MLIEYRFEDTDQIFEGAEHIILPAGKTDRGLLERYDVTCEIPSVLWEDSLERTEAQLSALKDLGLKKVIADNISGIYIAKKLGLNVTGGAGLNVMNSESAEEYASLGVERQVLSFEMSFAKMKKLDPAIPVGYVSYGHLPLMKYRACPVRATRGCSGCKGFNHLTDRTGASFALLCRDREYQELLNCVPLYTADKDEPKLDFKILYFTTESKSECERIAQMAKRGETPDFERTCGLYMRKLL